MLTRIISGGQTGVDQAALRATIAFGLPVGGWCPPGRVCEDGEIPPEFPLQETPDDRSPAAPATPRSQRTEWNVRDSDGTLLLFPGDLSQQDPGTRWTAECAQHYSKAMLIIDPDALADVLRVHHWIHANNIAILNVAGPRESSCPGIGTAVERFIGVLLSFHALQEQQL
jgi:hypothetical protein